MTTIAHFLAILVGAPSIALVAWLADIASRRALDRPLFTSGERDALKAMMVIVGIAVYPSALGYVSIDVYRFGFTPFAPILIAAAGIALAFRRSYALAFFTLAVLVALDVQLLPSANVFDYFVDPVGGICALAWLSARPLMRVPRGAFDARRAACATGSGAAADGSPV